ncbi:ATP-binding protein [Pseudofrankia inefficax]|uniref:IstB domain protein ATP-binding protein n=1 Tax=Pseudofrankia inefficax (strain DSM 45817 / CECT 9037 / DDB 130130 / EuI1c) TaxID=298654 RepID=E3J648_PSEI1|nr:ATP-binding protein [Pseudofrankia inefficax]ADP78339.1 IstB domain protein ATP-binding protein [Pseudofrankia inefficax]
MTTLDRTIRLGGAVARCGQLRIPTGVAPAADPIPTGETPEDVTARLAAQAAGRLARYRRQRPAAYAAASLGDLGPNERAAIWRWLESDSLTLVITGPVGTGKTHAAFAAANWAAGQGTIPAAWTVPDLMVDLAPEGDPSAAHVTRTAPLLLLDDLGVEKTSEWRVEQITALIDNRLGNGLRQIVTANADYDALARRYGERAMSRLTARAGLVRLTGADRRRVTW